MSLQCTRHFPVIAIRRGKKVGTNEKKNDVIAIDVPINRFIDFLACDDPTVVPGFDDSLVLKHRELLLKLIA